MDAVHTCVRCHQLFPGWRGQCSRCRAYGTICYLLDAPVAPQNLNVYRQLQRHAAMGMVHAPKARTGQPSRAADLEEREAASDDARASRSIEDVEEDATEHLASGLGEFDRVIGGGVVLGGTYLVGGPPGVGKSTLLLQALSRYSKKGLSGLYLSGEETEGQVAARARRLGAKNVRVYSETDLDAVIEEVYRCEPSVVILDSAQTIKDEELGQAGSPLQVKRVAEAAVQWSHDLNAATFIVGHVTKDGDLAGPKTFEHLVDATLEFEGDRETNFRTLRARKHRFGSAQEGNEGYRKSE